MALNYGTSTALASTSFSSLASKNTTATAAASSAAATTSTTANVTDAMARVQVVTPAFTPTASTTVDVYVYGSEDGTQWPGAAATSEVLAGTDVAVSLSSLSNNLRFLGTIQCHTSGGTFTTEPMSIAAAFGGFLPRKWAILIQNNLPAGVSLTSGSVKYSEIYYN
jgi:hypothetical protein